MKPALAGTSARPFLGRLGVTASEVVLLCSGLVVAQKAPAVSPPTTADIQVVSAELQRFSKPIRIGVGPGAIEYQEALVLKLRADRKQLDSFPPDMQPYLYIGREEYRIFHEERNDERPDLVLTVHVRNWEKLPEGAPLVLTILHGSPARNPDKFVRPGTPRLSRRLILDKR